MPFHIQQEPLDAARDEAIAVLDATRQHAVDVSRFEWLYRGNPDGEAVLWAIRESNTGEMAGFTVALPRRMLVNGDVRMAWNGADFSILPRFRTLGLALKLRRAAKNGIDAGEADFLYAHPNEKMAVIHAKVGHSPVGKMVRYAKVLKTEAYLKQRVGSGALAAVGAAVADPLLRIAGAESRHRAKYDTRLLETLHFDEQFDQLFQQTAPQNGVVGIRDSQYLNWRYRDNPLDSPQVILAEKSGHLAGYLVFVVQDEVGYLKDLFPMNDPQVARDLLSKATRIGRKLGLSSLSFTLLNSNPLLPALADFGFRERSGSSQMFGYAPPESSLASVVLDAASWWITVGDRDV